MDGKKILFGAVAYAVIAQVVHALGSIASMSYYADPSLFSMWSKLMMPGNSPPGAEFFIASLAAALVSGAIFTYLYEITRVVFLARAKKDFHGGNPYMPGLKFGAIMFLAVSFTGFMTFVLLFAFPLGLQLEWLAEGFVIFMLWGTALGKIYR
jgi:hypothetical protein